MQQHLSPWMIESAYRYLTAAKHLLRVDNMMGIAQVNAALGLEILLKSFNSKPSGDIGQVYETQKLNFRPIVKAHKQLKAMGKIQPECRKTDRHDLLTLFYAIPEDLRRRVGLDLYEQDIEQYRDVFTKSRYRYERKTKRSTSDILVRVLDEVIGKTIEWYCEQGCEDAYIRHLGKTV
ncbi:MAG: hypothetical protein ACRERW_05930 [Pseudomonas sp.]